MKLVELEPQFLKLGPQEEYRGEFAFDPMDPSKGTYFETRKRQTYLNVDEFTQADGVMFLCPKCFLQNSGPRGTHMCICWQPRVPLIISPGPGRWNFQGSNYDDLTLVAGSSSILIQGGCNAHFWIRNGEICW
jgi:hypothetical protein